MNDLLWVPVLISLNMASSGVDVKGPDGYALIGVLVLLLIPVVLYFFSNWLRSKGKKKTGTSSFFKKKKLTLTLEKNKLYYPDYLKLTVFNNGRTDIDLDRPLLTFSHIWLKRKFRLKGSRDYHFYPLLLEPGKSHELTIDLHHFYRHDHSLKKFPRITVSVNEVDHKNAVSQSIMIRKTMFR